MFLRSLLCALFLLPVSAHAHEKIWPTTPIRLLFSSPVGPNDMSERVLVTETGVELARMFVVSAPARNNFQDIFARRNGEASPRSEQAREYIVSRLENGRAFINRADIQVSN